MHKGVRLYLPLTAAAVLALGALIPTAANALTHRQTPLQTTSATSAVDEATPQPMTPQPAATRQPGGTADGAEISDALGVRIDFTGDFIGWAMLDRGAGLTTGHNLTSTSSTESMVKTWLVADYLRRADAKGEQPRAQKLEQARDAIRHSDDDAAQTLYEANGGDDSIERMIEMCGLQDTTIYPDWWSRTQMSPRDAVQLGACLADGVAAGSTWTPWLLEEMRQVIGSTAAAEQEETRGGGRWGIIDGVPGSVATTLAIKNGWTSVQSDGNWHVNCLAISDEWVMSVMLRYPAGAGLDYGADVCRTVASQLTPLP
jgi:hypothetical protein